VQQAAPAEAMPPKYHRDTSFSLMISKQNIKQSIWTQFLG